MTWTPVTPCPGAWSPAARAIVCDVDSAAVARVQHAGPGVEPLDVDALPSAELAVAAFRRRDL
jgi:hypothetical protein